KFAGDAVTMTQPGASFRAGGPRLVTAQLNSEDRLKVDNTRWRVVDVASELKTLIVEGERAVGRLGGSGAFLELALAPPKESPAARPHARPPDQARQCRRGSGAIPSRLQAARGASSAAQHLRR